MFILHTTKTKQIVLTELDRIQNDQGQIKGQGHRIKPKGSFSLSYF